MRRLFPLHFWTMDVTPPFRFALSNRFFRYNEDQRLREVYKRFNVDELKRKAAACLDHGSCVSVSKLAEGGASKVFLLCMEDGFEAIAKIPTPIASPSYYLTASEVATMDFLRTQLSLLFRSYTTGMHRLQLRQILLVRNISLWKELMALNSANFGEV